MTRRTATRIAWGLWALDIALVVTIVAVSPSTSGEGPWGTAAGTLFVAVFATTGALIALRQPANPIGWLLCLAALTFTIGGVCVGISDQAVEQRWHGAGVTAAAWVGTFVWMLGAGPAATFVLLLFPDGRLPSRRWRPVAWVAGGSLATTFVGLALAPGRIEDTRVTNPFGAGGGTEVMSTVAGVGLVLLFASILASCASLVARYRATGHEQRQQLKWLAWSLPVVLAWLVASIWVEATYTGERAVDIANALSSIGLIIVPVAIAIAMLRHRLYDVDIVINRTLVYGSLTVTLAASYLGTVLVLQLVLEPLTVESDLAVAGSTLAVAALFRPARARIQAIVDRRFFRARYDAALTLEDFAARLRNQIDLDTVGTDLRGVVHDTMQPAHVSLWLRRTTP
ncbi:MAG: hypothetical protein M4D85_00815 [Actinomycetota bacterium]|nr:hypothetical protein [Actinomycetota bacterium]MDQ3663751.1 hypothetical protein [Actinomycetota bacterium]